MRHAREKEKIDDQLHEEVRGLPRRAEDPEDLRDLNAAIERNAGKPGIAWDQVKKEIGL